MKVLLITEVVTKANHNLKMKVLIITESGFDRVIVILKNPQYIILVNSFMS